MPPRRITFSEVGRQNIIYSGAEQTAISNALETTEAGLLRLSTLRSNGAARRHQLKDQIRRYKVALAPYKKIPKEIWMYIFELYCQSGQLNTCVTRQPLVVLTHVCSAWRQIVLSMPKLWSDVYLGEDVKLARMCFERGGNIPRVLETSPPLSHRRFNRPPAIQSFICSFPFRKLHLTKFDTGRIDFAGIPVESLLLLEDLAIFNSDYPSRVTSFSPHQFPNLVSLHIGIDTTRMLYFHLPRPFGTWKKLRVLRLECTRRKAACLEILRDAPSVEDCSLHVFGQDSQNSTFENVVVPNLKILRLSFSTASWSILDHLTIPNLHTLVLFSQNSNNLKEFDKSPLLRLAQRVGSLRSLNIHHLYVNVDVGLVLECLPLLQVLELHCQKITTHTTKKIGSGELGGCLRELHDWSSHNVYQFLQACELRRDVTQGQCPDSSGAIARLEKVSVKSSNETGCKRRIRELLKDGVEFEVCDQHPM